MSVRRLVLVVMCWGMVAVTMNGQARSAAGALEAARKTAVVDGDCAAAIKQYEAIVARYEKSERAAAAQALLRMGECYEKLGNAEAQKVYGRVIREFGDQAGVVAEARGRMGAPAGVPSSNNDPFPRLAVDTRVGIGDVPSPDGSLVLTSVDGSRLIERTLATGKERVLLGTERDAGQFPGEAADIREIGGPILWSPDGRLIAFSVQARTRDFARVRAEIRVLDRTTGIGRTLGSVTSQGAIGLSPVAWSRDNQLLYSTWPATGPLPGQQQFFMVSASTPGTPPRQVLRSLRLVASAIASDQFGDLLPDGKAVILVRSERLTIVDLESEEERQLTLGVGVAVPRVSPDGRLLAYLSRQAGSWALYVAPLDTQPIRNPLPIAKLDGNINIQPWWKPRWFTNGTLVFDHQVGGRNVYRIDMDSATGRPLTIPERLTATIPGGIAWISPDSKHIAYSGMKAEVVVMDADGARPRKLSGDGPNEIGPRPDGNYGIRGWRSPNELLVHRSTAAVYGTVVGSATDGVQLAALNIDTGVLSTLPVFAKVPNWRYFAARDEVLLPARGLGLIGRSLSNGTERTVAEGLNGTLSRDGTKLAVSQDGVLKVFALDREGRGTVIASLGAPDGGLPRDWSPDGSFVLYEGRSGLRVFSLQEGKSWPLYEPSNSQKFVGPETSWDWFGDASWSPDGTFVVATIGTSRTQRLAFGGVTLDAVKALVGRR